MAYMDDQVLLIEFKIMGCDASTENQGQFDETAALFDRLGGEKAIGAVVQKFYEFMLADEVTSPFFKNTDMKKQIDSQKRFLTMVTGGPNRYEGAGMKEAHDKFKIGKKEFDQTWVNLERALGEFKVHEKEVTDLKEIFYSVEKDIVTVEEASLYDRLGGEPAVGAVVEKFYEFMLADDLTSPFFKNTDMKKQVQRQKQFITMVTGGPNNYEGADMKTAHAKFKIGKKEFDQTWFNLEKSLNHFNVPDKERSQVKTVFYSVESDVITDTTDNSLYVRLGGQPAIGAVVDKFYEFMLQDEVTAPFFKNTDMKKQAESQKRFIMMAVGGPNNYEGADMKTAHAKFKIGKKEFDQTWFNLHKALKHFNVPEQQTGEVKDVFYSVEPDVVNA